MVCRVLGQLWSCIVVALRIWIISDRFLLHETSSLNKTVRIKDKAETLQEGDIFVPSFLVSPQTSILYHLNPSFHAHSTHIKMLSVASDSTQLDKVGAQDGVRREMGRIVLFTASLRGEGVKDGGSWIWLCGGEAY